MDIKSIEKLNETIKNLENRIYCLETYLRASHVKRSKSDLDLTQFENLEIRQCDNGFGAYLKTNLQ